MSICADLYQGKFDKPVYQYRYGAVDPDFPDFCADADASVSGITFYTGPSQSASDAQCLYAAPSHLECISSGYCRALAWWPGDYLDGDLVMA
jgi:hypothetical protein